MTRGPHNSTPQRHYGLLLPRGKIHVYIISSHLPFINWIPDRRGAGAHAGSCPRACSRTRLRRGRHYHPTIASGVAWSNCSTHSARSCTAPTNTAPSQRKGMSTDGPRLLCDDSACNAIARLASSLQHCSLDRHSSIDSRAVVSTHTRSTHRTISGLR